MALHWDDALLVGNAEIDGQHQQIFDHFEKLSQACQDGRGEEVLKGLLKFLDEYAAQHFSCEEAFMAQHNYPKLPEQQEQHAHFRQTVKELQEMDLKNTDAHHVAIRIDRELILWFIQHINRLDQEMVTCILAREQ